jgi:hydrogenase maturation protease
MTVATSPLLPGKPILLLALGNDIISDDAAGLMAARQLEPELGSRLDVVESGEAGLALMEMMTGYQRAIIIDAVVTGKHPPGTVIVFHPEDFQAIVAPSAHYAGVPECFELAGRLGFPMPEQVLILAIEAENASEIHEGLTPAVEAAMPAYVEIIRKAALEWLEEMEAVEKSHTNSGRD